MATQYKHYNFDTGAASPSKCENCIFWEKWKHQTDIKFTIGNCRKKAPTLFPLADNKFATKFPSIPHDSFCGEWAQSFQTVSGGTIEQRKPVDNKPT
jgi:hypothetical protein